MRTTRALRAAHLMGPLAAVAALTSVGVLLAGISPAAAAPASVHAEEASDLLALWCSGDVGRVGVEQSLVQHLLFDVLAEGAGTVRTAWTQVDDVLADRARPEDDPVRHSQGTTVLQYRASSHRVRETSTLLDDWDGLGTTSTTFVADRDAHRSYELLTTATTRSAQRQAQLKALGRESVWLRRVIRAKNDPLLLMSELPTDVDESVFNAAGGQVAAAQGDDGIPPTCVLDGQGRLLLADGRDSRLLLVFDSEGRITAVTGDAVWAPDDTNESMNWDHYRHTQHVSTTISYTSSKIAVPAGNKTVTPGAWSEALTRVLLPKLETASLTVARLAVAGVSGRTARQRALSRAVIKLTDAYRETYGTSFQPFVYPIDRGVGIKVSGSTRLSKVPKTWSFSIELKGSKVVVSDRHALS